MFRDSMKFYRDKNGTKNKAFLTKIDIFENVTR